MDPPIQFKNSILESPLPHGLKPRLLPTVSGKIAVIPVITPAKILEPSSKELFCQHMRRGKKLDARQSTDRNTRESLR
jgi:hypothetical protein